MPSSKVYRTIGSAVLIFSAVTNSRARAATDITPASTAVQSFDDARVDMVDLKNNSIALTKCSVDAQNKNRSTQCSGAAVSAFFDDKIKPQVAPINAGDRVRASLEVGPTAKLQSIDLHSHEVPRGWRLLMMCTGYIVPFLLATFLTGGHPLRLIIGQDNRYSNSQFQLALWFSVLISTYLTLVVCRVYSFGWDFWGGVNIPTNLLALSGASALTFGAAKGITTAKVQAAVAAGAPNAKPAGNPHFTIDLVSNDVGAFDLGDFQMLVVTLLAVAMYLVGFFHGLGIIQSLKTVMLPDVDTTILTAFGLGQGAYLTKKAAGSLGTS